jgi:hypothetical protein
LISSANPCSRSPSAPCSKSVAEPPWTSVTFLQHGWFFQKSEYPLGFIAAHVQSSIRERKDFPLANPALTLNWPLQFPKGAQRIGRVSNGLLLTRCWPTLEYRGLPLRRTAHWRARDFRQSSQVPTLQLLRAQLTSVSFSTPVIRFVAALAAYPDWRGVHSINLRRRVKARQVQANGSHGVLSEALTSGFCAAILSPVSNKAHIRAPGHTIATKPRVLCRAPSAFYQLTFRAPGPQIVLLCPVLVGNFQHRAGRYACL